MRTFSKIIQELYPYTNQVHIRFVERALRECYMYPEERKYHNWEHVENCLAELEQINKEHLFEDNLLVALALFYHDSRYEPLEKDNEERSAERAFIDLLALKFKENATQKVYDLIMLTKHSSECAYFSGQVLMDIDIAILGKDYSTFEKYEKDIRAEYTSVTDTDYKIERIKVLVSFLKKKCIYQTKYFRDKYEESARSNILKIMDNLRQGISVKNIFPQLP
jgi:predicted metal-dependent HD superfamily phosphohydrolase